MATLKIPITSDTDISSLGEKTAIWLRRRNTPRIDIEQTLMQVGDLVQDWQRRGRALARTGSALTAQRDFTLGGHTVRLTYTNQSPGRGWPLIPLRLRSRIIR